MSTKVHLIVQNLAELLSARVKNRVLVLDTFEAAICSKK